MQPDLLNADKVITAWDAPRDRCGELTLVVGGEAHLAARAVRVCRAPLSDLEPRRATAVPARCTARRFAEIDRSRTKVVKRIVQLELSDWTCQRQLGDTVLEIREKLTPMVLPAATLVVVVALTAMMLHRVFVPTLSTGELLPGKRTEDVLVVPPAMRVVQISGEASISVRILDRCATDETNSEQRRSARARQQQREQIQSSSCQSLWREHGVNRERVAYSRVGQGETPYPAHSSFLYFTFGRSGIL